MVTEMAEAGDNEKPSYFELTKELEKLRENDCERKTRMTKLTNDNRKIRERLKALERMIQGFPLARLTDENERNSNTDDREGFNEQLIRTFIELTCECVVINKKLKYLRRLMKLNTQKLRDLENVTKGKGVKESEDKFCQTELGDGSEDITSRCASQDSKSDGASSDMDTLMSEMFYLPTHPDLPDLRLFNML